MLFKAVNRKKNSLYKCNISFAESSTKKGGLFLQIFWVFMTYYYLLLLSGFVRWALWQSEDNKVASLIKLYEIIHMEIKMGAGRSI